MTKDDITRVVKCTSHYDLYNGKTSYIGDLNVNAICYIDDSLLEHENQENAHRILIQKIAHQINASWFTGLRKIIAHASTATNSAGPYDFWLSKDIIALLDNLIAHHDIEGGILHDL